MSHNTRYVNWFADLAVRPRFLVLDFSTPASTQVAVRIPLETKARLEIIAQRDGLSMYALMRRVVDEWLRAR